jgi:hypothetical protein
MEILEMGKEKEQPRNGKRSSAKVSDAGDWLAAETTFAPADSGAAANRWESSSVEVARVA